MFGSENLNENVKIYIYKEKNRKIEKVKKNRKIN